MVPSVVACGKMENDMDEVNVPNKMDSNGLGNGATTKRNHVFERILVRTQIWDCVDCIKQNKFAISWMNVFPSVSVCILAFVERSLL